MAIRYQCSCGARILLPDGAAGKRARCKSCSAVFTVPVAPGVHSVAETAAAEPVAPVPEFVDEDKPSFLRRLYEGVPPTEEGEPVEMWKTMPAWEGPESFWAALAASFWFFKTPGNLATFVAIVLAQAFCAGLVDVGGIVFAFGSLVLFCYLCAFYLSTVSQTASGDDALPTVWISNPWDDLIVPLGQFIGTFVWALLPAFAVAAATEYRTGAIAVELVVPLAVVGLLLWPAVVLAVAIGGGFNGIWPHVIVRTVMSAPVAYLAVCACVLVAYGIMGLPETSIVQAAGKRMGPPALFVVPLISSVCSVYAMIVAMRVIGLYYRHYKARFPWSAE